MRDTYNTFEGKRPLGGPGCIWEDNIKMDIVGQGWKMWTEFA
jgi:hypothetical protein